MEQKFKYQLLWLRVLGAIPMVCLVYLIQRNVIHPFILSNSVYLVDLGLVLLGLSFYYNKTEKHTWFLRDGKYEIVEGILKLQYGSKSKEIPMAEINDVFLYEKNMLGSRLVLFQVKWNGKRMKLFSKPLIVGQEIQDTDFCELFRVLEKNVEGLEAEKDIWGNEIGYWIKRR